MIGRVLDKYEIIEEVGQGGMSVVYRGRDRVLLREVAVKVLHPHLASAEEARRRFEREAHAVAKLRHENILEIFDYSGTDSAASYIVTEFINGRTLKGHLADHEPAFAEIGALVVVEILRALAHAHSLGVLHRDVKPENIMIRDDGVLKLTDFGIAQIVDAQRMTVTGQLLGSPAYMSPEHVEGRPLDFRTDVFAAGILLYQLAAHELPFKGKNPHEILKRIAECRYLDARVVNPRIGDRLNRIIARALAREPDDRYPDVSSMLDDLVRFLAEVDLGDPRAELRRYFADPLGYEQALRQRLLAALAKRARAELGARRTAAALELCNRVLTIDPAHEEVLALLDRVAQRRRAARMLALAAAGFAVAGVATLVARLVGGSDAVPTTPPVIAAEIAVRPSPPPARTAPTTPAPIAPSRPAPPPRPTARPEIKHDKPTTVPQPTAPAAPRTFVFMPNPRNAEYSVDGSAFVPIRTPPVRLTLGPGGHRIVFRHPLCDDEPVDIGPGDEGRDVPVRLAFKSASLTAICPAAKVITVDDKVTFSGTPLPIRDFKESKRDVVVEFRLDDTKDRRVVEMVPGATVKVTCGSP